MKIAVEASSIVERCRTGVGIVATHFVEEVARAMPEDELYLVHFGSAAHEVGAALPMAVAAPNIRDAPIRGLSVGLYARLLRAHVAPAADRFLRAAPDVFFFPNFIAWPVRPPCRTVVLVHDLAFLKTPSFVRDRTRRELERLLPSSVRDAAAVVAVSESTRRDIAGAFDIAPDRLTVVSPAVDHSRYFPQPSEALAPSLARYGLSPGYVLFVGTLEPRKNVAGLLRAYSRVSPDIRARHPLVLVGRKGWHDEEIERTLADVTKRADVRRLGFVPQTDLPALYGGASAFAYPSFMEGFGLPVLEAMACGTPVVTAPTSSLPEAAGEAALYADPSDEAAIADRLSSLLTDPGLATRCRELGLRRAALFRWEASGQRLAALFRRVAGAEPSL